MRPPTTPRPQEAHRALPPLCVMRTLEEEAGQPDPPDNPGDVETVTIRIGNEHRLRRPDGANGGNALDCMFFVRPARTDAIQEVQICLHVCFCIFQLTVVVIRALVGPARPLSLPLLHNIQH